MGNILVIEDDEAKAEALVRVLEKQGFCVRCVANRLNAIEAMNRYLYNAVILSFSTLATDKRAFVRELNVQHPNVSVVLI
jgi:DNA-binding response OmpR family regulator